MWNDFNFAQFWTTSAYAKRHYVEKPPSHKTIQTLQDELGYTLPQSYISFFQYQNGGIPTRTIHTSPTPTSWSDDSIAIHALLPVGIQKSNSIGGTGGSRYWIDDWGYPNIGIYFADCPSGGHDMLCLDYRTCGPHGEPQVVHVDQDYDYAITVIAPSFQEFILGLREDL